MNSETVEQIRSFNRFYTVYMGLLNSGYLSPKYSILQSRTLFELRNQDGIRQSDLVRILHVDKSYLSRTIKQFEKNGLVQRIPSLEDRRAATLKLTEKGTQEADAQIQRANVSIGGQIVHMSATDQKKLCRAMETIMELLQKGDKATD